MKFYDLKAGMNPWRLRIFLAEKGINVPKVEVDMPGGENRAEPFLSINPLGTMPVLELDDGTILTESIAICRYFEELHPDPPLMGTTPLEQATIEMWQRRMEFNLMNNVAAVFRHTHPAMAELEVPQIADLAEASRPRVQAALEMLDDQLGKHHYVAGDSFSIADITALVGVDFTKVGRIQVPENLANLARWRAEVSARPSAKAGMS